MTESRWEAELREFQQNHQTAKTRLKALLLYGRILSLVLVLVIAGYLTALYGKVTTMYAPEQFEEPILREAENLMPRLEPQLRMLWAETAPVYGEMAIDKLESALPAIQEISSREFNMLSTSLTTNAQNQIHSALDRIARRQQRRLAKHFPNLSTEEGAEELGLRWVETVQNDFEDVVLYFNARYAEDLGELEATLEQFRSEEFENMPEDELIRQFVHLWLMKIDRMVMLQDQEEVGHDR